MLGNAKIDVISYLLLSSSAEPGIGYLSLGHLVACCKGIFSFIYPSSILNFIKGEMWSVDINDIQEV